MRPRRTTLTVLLGAWLLASLGARGGTQPAPQAAPVPALSEGFEGAIPDLHTYRAKYAGDGARAHSGTHSLRVTPEEGGTGGAYFHLDGLVDGKSDYEFSVWVWAAKSGGVKLYISASDGKQRHNKGEGSGGVAGQWVQVTGTLSAQEWRPTDRDVMLAMVTNGESWFDDAVLRTTVLPKPPIRTYPAIGERLRSLAAVHPVALEPGKDLSLAGRAGVLAAGFQPEDQIAAATDGVVIPPDGMLAFAVQASRAVYLEGTLELEPDADLRPGLRATVLGDDTVLAAPVVNYPAGWRGEGNALTGPAPLLVGEKPPVTVPLARWRVAAGRHTLMVAGPHFRPGGRFLGLRLRVLDRPAPEPLYQFALLSDTHLGSGRGNWMNDKLNGPAHAQLAETLADLRAEGTRFALLAGDMTDNGTRPQFESLGRIAREAGLPVYGCVGNHDGFLASGRPDLRELCAPMFPGGSLDYVFTAGPLRFIVLDGSYWKRADGTICDYYDPQTSRGVCARPEQVQWLKDTLAADTKTPTLFVWHYPLYSRQGLSSCGYRLPNSALGPEVRALLAAAPNVRGALCGHTHWNEYNQVQGQHHLVNTAFAEWPNSFRVLRVYADRVEWEVRQPHNRGFVRESFTVRKALAWMLSTAEGDLGGEFGL